jgi:hypothetical protein
MRRVFPKDSLKVVMKSDTIYEECLQTIRDLIISDVILDQNLKFTMVTSENKVY